MKNFENNDFLCPHCKGHLNTGGHVIFSTKNKKRQKGLILLSPKVGSYNYEHHENYNFQKNEVIEFSCPICGHSLESSKNQNYASIIMVDHNNEEYEMLFSRKEGDKSTYVVARDSVESFGEDALSFDDIFEDY